MIALKSLVPAVATVWLSSAGAQTMYRCTAPDGSTTYQDRPCASSMRQEQPNIAAPPVSRRAQLEAKLRAIRDQAEVSRIESQEAYEQAMRQAQAARRNAEEERTRRTNDAGRQYGIAVGQSASDVRKTFGDPQKVNFSADGSEQWVYRNERSEIQYVYLRNGAVTSWQGTRTRP